jgi:SOS-response transcriptional repressor LexA
MEFLPMGSIQSLPPAQTGLTTQQRACLDAIEAYFARTRTMPSLENLRVALGFASKGAVFRLLRQLEERGRIARVPLRARSIRLLDDKECPRCRERIAP